MMQLRITEDQHMLAKTASDVLDSQWPIDALRTFNNAITPPRSPLWSKLTELGWSAMLLPSAHGGLDMNMADAVVVLEALGSKLAPTPLLSTVVTSAHLLNDANAIIADQWLTQIADGNAIVTLAHREPHNSSELSDTVCEAKRVNGSWRIIGSKSAVRDGMHADAFLIPARTSGLRGQREGLSLFMVPSNRTGLHRTAQSRIDHRDCCCLNLDVLVDDNHLIGDVDMAIQPLEHALDRCRVGLAAEMLGGMSAAFDMTLDYLKTRTQFNQPIGVFQALQHRAARLFIDIELCRSSVMAAARVASENPERLASYASLAKARCSEAFLNVCFESIQMHGGIGMTDEHDAGLYLKRAQVDAASLGNASWHRSRWASLRQY